MGTYWEVVNGDLIVSSDTLGESSTITTLGESDFNDLAHWEGWNFFWQQNNDPDQAWAIGFYKVYNDLNNKYFYVDCRVDNFGLARPPYQPPDFWVYLDGVTAIYYYYDAAFPNWNQISNTGDIVRIGDVHNTSPPSSNSLEDFWDNVLVLIDGGSGHPRIAWSPYPDNSHQVDGYKIYRAITTGSTPPSPGSFSLVATKNSTTYEWVDTSIDLGGINYAHYFVKAKLIPTKAPSFDS